MNKSACHISTTFLYKAGSCRRTYAVLRAMVEEGYQTTLVVGRDYLPAPDWDMTGIEVIKISSLVKYIDFWDDLKAAWQLYAIIKRLQPAIVHTHLAKAGILARLVAKGAGGKKAVVHTVHGPTFPKSLHPVKRLFYLAMEKVCGRFTDWFVFVGTELRDDFIRAGVSREENSVVIRSGRPKSDFERADDYTTADLLSLRDSLGVGRESFVMAYVARLVPSKAQDDAIKVLKEIRDAGVDGYLLLVGEGHLQEEKAYQRELESLAATLGIKDWVRFVGYQSEVFRYMKVADVLVMTSKYEGLPNVAVEAGICAKPLIAYRVCGLSEVIEDGKTGYVVEQGDIKGMASILTGLACRKDLIHEMGSAARVRLENEYNLEKMVKEKMLFYQDLMQRAYA